jgi:hypothetical protein
MRLKYGEWKTKPLNGTGLAVLSKGASQEYLKNYSSICYIPFWEVVPMLF